MGLLWSQIRRDLETAIQIVGSENGRSTLDGGRVSSNGRWKTVSINKTQAHARKHAHANTPFRRTFIPTVQPTPQFLYKTFSFNVTASLSQHLHVCRHVYCDHLLLDIKHRRYAHKVTELCDRRIHNDRAITSASSRQCACPFYNSRAGFFWGGGQSVTSPRSVCPHTTQI